MAPRGRRACDAICRGPKADLRAFHDRIVATAQGLGGDVQLAPKQAWVNVRRAKQSATVGPVSGDRLEVGLNLKDVAPAGRLEPATGMCTHHVRMSERAEFDAEVVGWLRVPYDRA
jgi:hypothetical protein